MRRQGIARHRSTYEALLSIYVKKGLLKTCDKLVAEMGQDRNSSGHAHVQHLDRCMWEQRGNWEMQATDDGNAYEGYYTQRAHIHFIHPIRCSLQRRMHRESLRIRRCDGCGAEKKA